MTETSSPIVVKRIITSDSVPKKPVKGKKQPINAPKDKGKDKQMDSLVTHIPVVKRLNQQLVVARELQVLGVLEVLVIKSLLLLYSNSFL